MDLDHKLISGKFFDNESLPIEKQYLLKYFKTKLQQQFLVYYVLFGDLLEQRGVSVFYECFMEHTGIDCTKKMLRRYIKRYKWIERHIEKCKKEGDIETIADIKSGKFKLRTLGSRDRGLD